MLLLETFMINARRYVYINMQVMAFIPKQNKRRVAFLESFFIIFLLCNHIISSKKKQTKNNNNIFLNPFEIVPKDDIIKI